jgi:hypothetical protein
MDRLWLLLATRVIGIVLPLYIGLPINLARAQSNVELADFFADIPDSKPSPAAAQEPQVASIRDDTEHLIASPKARKFPGWGPYAKHFKALCGAIAADGRAHELRELVAENLLRPEVCPACLPLAKALTKTCKPRRVKVSLRDKKKKMKHEEKEGVEMTPDEQNHGKEKKPAIATSTPNQVPRQREPRIEAVRAAIEFMRQLENDPQRKELGEQALAALVARLRGNQREEPEPGTQDYFAALADALEMPQQKTTRGLDIQSGSDSLIGENKPFGDNIHIGGQDSEDIDELFQ